jgi:hypothetical protein
MKKSIFFTTVSLFFFHLFCIAQNSIIVGPQNDCSLINKNITTSKSKFNVEGIRKIRIETFQHRTYDKSRIYDENGTIIWDWDGESYNDTWYKKEHFLNINSRFIVVEFYQGFDAPFCNGYIKVDKIVNGKVSSSNNTSQNKSNQYNSNITESSDCKDIVDAFELAVRKNITALRKIRNGAIVSINEVNEIDKDIRKWQDIVMKKCAYEPNYSFRVINIMEQLQLGYSSTFPSIKENSSSTPSNSKNSSSSNSRNSSTSNSIQSSNSIKNGETKNQVTKTEKKEVDLSYEVLSQTVSCKSCSSPVTVKMNVPRSDEFKKSFNQSGGLTSSMCNKCHKTSSFVYEMRAGKFVKIN